MWTIEQAIKHYEVLASRLEDICMKPASEYPKQTAKWLRELIWRRKAPEIVRCGECKHKKDHHYEAPGEEPYIKSTCGNKRGLVKNYQVRDWDFCSRAERKTDG